MNHTRFRWVDRAVAVVTLLAVILGWSYGYGKLSQKVDDLSRRVERIEMKIFDPPAAGK